MIQQRDYRPTISHIHLSYIWYLTCHLYRHSLRGFNRWWCVLFVCHLTMCRLRRGQLYDILWSNRPPVEGDFISPAPLYYNLLFLLEFLIPKKMVFLILSGGIFYHWSYHHDHFCGIKWGIVVRRNMLKRGERDCVVFESTWHFVKNLSFNTNWQPPISTWHHDREGFPFTIT
jgi:hypothetical protein